MSGDMFLGALVDAGVPALVLEETVAALGVGARLEISRVVRSGISATKVDVYVDGEKDLPREEYWARHSHSHEHSDHERRGHEESLRGESSRAGAPAPHEHSQGRGRTEIREIIPFRRARKRRPLQSSRRWDGRRRRFTILPSRACISTRSVRWMRWWISSAPPLGLKRW